MIQRFRLLENIGVFGQVKPSGDSDLKPLTLIYGESGRGKTTIASILCSLAGNNRAFVNGRQRPGAQHPSYIVVDSGGKTTSYRNGAWTASAPGIIVFDDWFVDNNVYSGTKIQPYHQQRLYKLVAGGQGTGVESDKERIESGKKLQNYTTHIAGLDKNLKKIAEKIPASVRGPYSIDEFCELKQDSGTVDKADTARQKARKARFRPDIASNCDEYIKKKEHRKNLEQKRDDIRKQLSQHRNNNQHPEHIFSRYQQLTNRYLAALGASFRLDAFGPKDHGAGASVSYHIMINGYSVDPFSDQGRFFGNIMGAGDRSTLALAFFLALVETYPDLKSRIVVLDDPITSLDEHRSARTCHVITTLAGRVQQIIVLSHLKSFLYDLWNQAEQPSTTALRLGRDTSGSVIEAWDIQNDGLSAHAKQHEMLRNYVETADYKRQREVAMALRPILESFLRVCYPEHFPPGSMIGQFVKCCEKNDGLLPQEDIDELQDLTQYANKFHHGTDLAWNPEAINDSELKDFAQRTLLFTSRRKKQAHGL